MKRLSFFLTSLTTLGGALRMDFPLSFLTLLTFSVLGSIISGSTLEVGETNTILFKALEEVLQEERKSDHTRDRFYQMQPFENLAFHLA